MEFVMNGFVEVTKEQFWSFVKTTDLNIHPYNGDRDFATWKLVRDNDVVVGRSYPGWANPGDPERFLLRPQYVA
jgi:hypothetical protein